MKPRCLRKNVFKHFVFFIIEIKFVDNFKLPCCYVMATNVNSPEAVEAPEMNRTTSVLQDGLQLVWYFSSI